MRTGRKKESGSRQNPTGYVEIDSVDEDEVEFGRPEALADEEFAEADEPEERRRDPLRQ